MGRITRKPALALAVGAAVIATVSIWLTVGHTSTTATHPPAPVSTIDSDRRACLLTDATADAKTVNPVLANLRAAAASSQGLLLQDFTLPPSVTPKVYLNTLSHMRCQTIITIGDTLRTPAAEAAHTNTTTQRYIVITEQPVSAPHAISLTPAQATRAALTTAIDAAP
jgi:hypothetical protein